MDRYFDEASFSLSYTHTHADCFFVCDGLQQYSVPAPLLTVTHFMNIINSELHLLSRSEYQHFFTRMLCACVCACMCKCVGVGVPTSCACMFQMVRYDAVFMFRKCQNNQENLSILF
jgi:hypothetical protein